MICMIRFESETHRATAPTVHVELCETSVKQLLKIALPLDIYIYFVKTEAK